jgi:hypothetical protein
MDLLYLGKYILLLTPNLGMGKLRKKKKEPKVYLRKKQT